MTKVYFRADGNSRIGLGHVIRSIALADILSSRFECYFIIKEACDAIRTQILEVCRHILEVPSTNSLLQEAEVLADKYISNEDILVLDGYHFDVEYQRKIRASGCILIVVDDIHTSHMIADAVINHGPKVSPKNYSKEPYTELHLGLGYSLLRAPFLKATSFRREIKKVRKVFLCFGGSDIQNNTVKVLRELTKSKSDVSHINVVIGSAYKWLKELKSFTESVSTHTINIYSNLSAIEMYDLMKESELAIVPSSSILYEAASVGMAIISGYCVDNQVKVFEGFSEKGLIWPVGDITVFSDYTGAIEQIEKNDVICEMMKRQEELVSGQSAVNLLDLFIYFDPQVKVTRARRKDMDLYYAWANDREVRDNAISPKRISLTSHKIWFQSKLEDPNTVMYLFEKESIPFGQVRFDKENGKVIIDYSIAASFRGRRLGKMMLTIAMKKYQKDMTKESNLRFVGVVRATNLASRKIFISLGYNASTQPYKIGNELYVNFEKPINYEH